MFKNESIGSAINAKMGYSSESCLLLNPKANVLPSLSQVFDDAAKSPMSVVIVDNIEGLIEYNPVGPRFSNYMVQALKDLVSQPLPAVSSCFLDHCDA